MENGGSTSCAPTEDPPCMNLSESTGTISEFGDSLAETTMDERIKGAQYLLLNSEGEIKRRIAEIQAAYETAHGGSTTGAE
jgi:hypothetical protein